LTGHLLLLFHGFAAAVDGALTAAGNDKLGAALFAAVSFAYLICHDKVTIL